MNKGRNKVKKIDPGMMELVKDTMISPTESFEFSKSYFLNLLVHMNYCIALQQR